MNNASYIIDVYEGDKLIEIVNYWIIVLDRYIFNLRVQIWTCSYYREKKVRFSGKTPLDLSSARYGRHVVICNWTKNIIAPNEVGSHFCQASDFRVDTPDQTPTGAAYLCKKFSRYMQYDEIKK